SSGTLLNFLSFPTRRSSDLQILMFQFVYPADYHDIIPKWLFDELINRATEQYDLPPSLEKVCRGPVIDQTQYCTDIKEWNYKAIDRKSTRLNSSHLGISYAV